MMEDDGIREETIANMVKGSPDMSWLANISPDGQKKVMNAFMTLGNDPMAMMTALSQIPEAASHFPPMQTQSQPNRQILIAIK